ncbi:Gfo/Idh/MocA family protein [Roseomonas sp. BN140053]|uniref:Gfo/Idh/MocA family protein n=1 Tax=Roseomonas sp. BN140053 TaxID=3391898 RepID=UPI0039EC8975
MSATRRLGVGVLGAHAWAEHAHLPGFAAYERCRRVAICDVVPERARALAERFGFERVYADAREMLADPEVEMVDVCTPTGTHRELAGAALAAGRHVLCEKPLALSAADAFGLARLAAEKGLRTKVGFTFRYSAALKQVKRWIEDGTIGEIFHVHGFQQNSQFLDPNFPLRQYDTEDPDGPLVPASIVGYGSHLVDLLRWLAGDFRAVSALMRNFVPERMVRGKEGLRRVPIDDGTVAAVDFRSGAQGVIQTSFIAIGNYPGIEIRIYGSKVAVVARLVTEFGVAETLHLARAGEVEFRPVELSADRYPPGTDVRTPWRELYYRQLARDWTDEILDEGPAENTFLDGAMSQQMVDAVVLSHRERRWVDLSEMPS